MVRSSCGIVSRARLLTFQKDDGCPNPAHRPEINLSLSSLKDLKAFLLTFLRVSGCWDIFSVVHLLNILGFGRHFEYELSSDNNSQISRMPSELERVASVIYRLTPKQDSE